MATEVRVDVQIDLSGIEDRLEEALDERTMLEINNTLARFCDPYVPFLNGPLSQTNVVSPEGVTYTTPYARRQYYGTDFNHTTDYHPLASAMWDQAMLRDRGDDFDDDIARIIARRMRELDG